MCEYLSILISVVNKECLPLDFLVGALANIVEMVGFGICHTAAGSDFVYVRTMTAFFP